MEKVILKSDRGYSVSAEITKDVTADRVAVTIYVENPEGEVVSSHSISRTNILRNKQAFSYLLDSTALFKENEVKEIAAIAKDMLESVEQNDVATCNSKMPMADIYYWMCEYFMNTAIDTDKSCSIAEIQKTGSFKKGDYILVRTDALGDFISKYKENGCSRLDILRWLKSNRKLEVGSGREYDKVVSIHNAKIRVYKIRICQTIPDAEDVEEIQVSIDEPEMRLDNLKLAEPRRVQFASDEIVLPTVASAQASQMGAR